MPAATSTTAGTSSPKPASKKFSTVSSQALARSGAPATASAPSNNELNGRPNVKGLFEGHHGSKDDTGLQALGVTSKGSKRQLGFSSSKAGAMGREDGPWSVSVAEVPTTTTEKRESRKKQKAAPHMYTLYITTPTHNLTLLRSSGEIIELDGKIRESQSSASSIPSLPALPAATQQTSRKILQTISRTLSPSVSRSRAPLNALSAPGMGLNDSASPSVASASKKGSPVPSAPLSPSLDGANGASDSHTTTTHLATYLTSLSNFALVRKHKAWLRFTKVGPEDLESVRVERRVRKVRSDLAQHVKSSVAPTNTNVGATPSQSDIGEEGTRTTDDDRSISGQSTSASNRRIDRPDVPSRTTSADPERNGQREDREKKGGPNFANIPEEMEREKLAAEENGDEGAEDVVKRDRKYRRHTASREAEKVTVDDFDMIRVLGKGCAGKVLLVRHLPTKGLFAMKSIHKRHVLAHQELQHTLTEQAVLKRMAKEVMDPFVVRLWWSFHDKNNLYLIMDFHPGGDLATQLSRWGRLGRDRARFYAAEIVEGVEGLHRAGVIYRDLKPENVLIGSDGHIVLSDFGLSKEFPVRDSGGSSTPPPVSPSRSHSSKDVKQGSPHWLSASEDGQAGATTASSSSPASTGLDGYSKTGRSRWSDERDVTTTFCGTAEYLAPEVIQGAAYSYEVDWWSFGTMLYEMLTGITPFWANTHADMYVRVLHDELVFPDDRVLDQDTKSILRGLLQRNPMLRMKEPRIKRHPYFSMIEWAHVFHKRYIPPYIPPINPLDETDTQNFDEAFLDMQPVVHGAEDGADTDAKEDGASGAAKAAITTTTTSGSPGKSPAVKDAGDNKSLFDGYSYRGRRDSGSIKSSIISASAPSDDMLAERTAASAHASSPPATKTVDAGTLMPKVSVSAAPSTAVAGKVPLAATKDTAAAVEEDSDDEESAARAAFAALDHLEREAAMAEEMQSSRSQTSVSSPPTSTATSSQAEQNNQQASTTALTSKVRLEAPIVETDDEGEEDWDMVDAPAAGETYRTEINGGKGQNLFARGVVDTYRLLRRQESSRIPSSPSYGSGSFNRSLNRLSRRNRPSKRNLRPGTAETSGGNGSAVSLSRSSANEGGTEEESQEIERESQMGGPSPLPQSSTVYSPAEDVNATRQPKGNSPSLASSEDVASQERNKQRMKKIKRFTSFFESTR